MSDIAVIKRKSRRALGLLLKAAMHAVVLPFAVAGAIAVRLLRPLVLIRFSRIMGDRLGHYMLDMELYFTEQELGIQPRAIDLFFYKTPSCNLWLKAFYARRVRVCAVWETFLIVNNLLPGGEAHSVKVKARDQWGSRDQDGLFLRASTHLTFTESEQREGQKALRLMGVPEGAPYVCIHNRDSMYLDSKGLGVDWSYHDFRDNSIHTFYLAVEELLKAGYYVVRMGQTVKEPMRMTHPKLIDYALSGMRSDFLDIYIGARCKCFVLSQCGMSAVPEVMRGPIVFVHAVPLGISQSFTPNCISIYKKYRSLKDGSIASFKEVMGSGLGNVLSGLEIRKAGYEVIENTPEEVREVVLEMEQRLRGQWLAEPGDEELQRRFWELYRGNPMHNVMVSRAGAAYLRANRKMLD